MDEMPLLKLFTQLRDAGLPLSINDYDAVLRVIESGYDIADQETLARLCRTLWARSEDEQRLFDDYFESLTAPPQLLPHASPPAPVPPIPPPRFSLKYLSIGLLVGMITIGGGFAVKSFLQNLPPYGVINKPTHSPKPTVTSKATEPANQGFRLLETTEVLVVIAGAASSAGLVVLVVWLIQRITDRWVQEGKSRPRIATKTPEFALASESDQYRNNAIQAEQIVLHTTVAEKQINRRQAAVLDDFFPVSRRQLKQSWRYLRQLVPEGTAAEVDVPITVDQISRQGIFLKPVLVSRQKNHTQLLLLLDQGGSMVPFRALSARLIETALKGGRLGTAAVFHFHNYPTDSLYSDSTQRLVEPLEAILGRLSSRRVVVLIFSDAGAARGQFNLKRIDLTEEFLGKLRQRVRYVTWLNPVPRQRWVGTTAAEIAHLVPMFEMNRQGLNRAIAVLRGQSIAPEVRQ